MKFSSLIGALIAGVVGAAIWAAVSYYANVEIGYIAWGIGLLVGFAAHALGAEGSLAGIMCAVIALASMLGGKALATHFAVNQVVMTEMLPPVYEYTKADADAFQDVNTDDEIRQFMVTQEYTQAQRSTDVSPEELSDFNERLAQPLRDFQANQPTFDQWTASTHGQTLITDARSQFNLLEAVKDSLGPLDLIFGALGLSSAFKMAMADQDDEEIPVTDNYGSEYGGPPQAT